MNTATAILTLLALGMGIYAWRRDDGSLGRGLQMGWMTLRRTLALLLVAFALVGYVNVLAPQTLVQSWIGPESGWTGLLLGEFAGMLMPGGPYVIFPLIAALYQAGAGLGPTLAMISSWALLALITVSFEIPFLGWRFTAVRFALSLLLPALIGLVGMALFGPG